MQTTKIRIQICVSIQNGSQIYQHTSVKTSNAQEMAGSSDQGMPPCSLESIPQRCFGCLQAPYTERHQRNG